MITAYLSYKSPVLFNDNLGIIAAFDLYSSYKKRTAASPMPAAVLIKNKYL